MRFWLRKIEWPDIKVSCPFYLFTAAILLVVPLRWVVAFLISAGVHELWHMMSLKLLGVGIRRIRISCFGTEISTEPLSNTQELLAALAGPCGSFSLLLLARFLPLTALFATIHAVYNLLPVYPLDGGRVLRCLCSLMLPEELAARFCACFEAVVRTGILILGVYGIFVLHLGLLPLSVAILLLFKNRMKNTLQRRPPRGTIVLPML